MGCDPSRETRGADARATRAGAVSDLVVRPSGVPGCFAPADARAVREFLESDAAGPFDEVLYLENEQATGAALREALFVFLQQADWDDLVVIYYAAQILLYGVELSKVIARSGDRPRRD